MTDLAARLAERARPPTDAPTMVPYLPDRPADPRIAPESSLADFGGFGESDSDEPSLAFDDQPWVSASEPGPDLRAVIVGARNEASEPARAPTRAPVPPSRDAVVDRWLAPPGDVTSRVERIVERMGGDAPRVQSTPRSPTNDGFTLHSPTILRPEHSTDLDTSEPEPPVDSPIPAEAPRPPRDLPGLIPVQGPVEVLSRVLAEESTLPERPPGEARPSLPTTSTTVLPTTSTTVLPTTSTTVLPTTSTTVLPTSTSLLPRERPVALDEPILPPEAPTIHIGDITVEVVQAAPRTDPRHVQAPQERPRRSAATTKSTPSSTRPLRTFGLRQL